MEVIIMENNKKVGKPMSKEEFMAMIEQKKARRMQNEEARRQSIEQFRDRRNQMRKRFPRKDG